MMTWDFFFRLLVAGVLGAIIGLDREYRAKEAGFRTHFLVALGSALFMIVSKYGFWDILGDTGIGLDPSRIAAQVVSGIGFLGAGTIIIQKLFERIDYGCWDMGYFCHWSCSRLRTILVGNQCNVVNFIGFRRIGIYFSKVQPAECIVNIYDNKSRGNQGGY